MRINRKMIAIVIAFSMVMGVTYIDSPIDVNARENTIVDNDAYEVTPEYLANDEEWQAQNDPMYAKYKLSQRQMLKANSATPADASKAEGDRLVHDPRFKGYERIKGIDISYYQNKASENKTIDWNAVKADGVSFVIIRLGYRASATGTLTLDTSFKENIEGAHAVGIDIGVYFYTQAITEEEAKAEADFCADNLAEYSNYLKYPIMYDIENTSKDRMGKAKVTTAQRTSFCVAFCDEAIARGYTSGVYASMSYFQTKLNADTFSESYHNWLARYANSYNYGGKKYDGRYEMWQYTSSGTVNGIGGRIDMDIAYKLPCQFNWSPDKSSCTVTVVDENGITHVYQCQVTITKDVAATCTKAGTRELTATYGQYKDVIEFKYAEATGHKKVVKKKKAATYFVKGYSGDSVCNICGKVLSKGKQTAIKKLSKNSITSIKSKKSKKLTIKWKRNKNATGYQIQYSTDKKCKKLLKTVNVKSNKTTTKTLSCRKSKKKYYVRIRSYKTGKVNGKKKTVYGSWSTIKSVKVK